MSNTPPMGWYPDPSDPDTQYFWDGTAWTAERAGAPDVSTGPSESGGPGPSAEPRRRVQVGFPLAFLLLIVVVGAVGFFGLRGDRISPAVFTPDPRPGPTTAVSPEPDSTPIRCKPASEALLSAVEGGLVEGENAELLSGFAVKSLDHQRIWFVAAQVSGSRGGVGLWAVQDRDGRGPILSVNQLAADITDWPDGADEATPVTATDDGADEALSCIG